MVARTLDMVWVRTATQGTGTITLGEGVAKEFSRFLTFAEGGAVDGEEYAYFIQDGVGWERGSGTYSASANTLTRGVTISLSRTDGTVSTSALDLSGRATLACVLRASDQASIAAVQDLLEDATTAATSAAADAADAATSATAAAASAAAADPSGRVLRAGDTMTGALNLKRATVASHATTADIWSAGNIIDFTGTVTVTDFPDAPVAGARRHLICAAACTFTNNANIAVQGATNYTAAAGDIVTIDALTTSTFRATIQKASGLAVAPTPNTPNAVQIATSTVSSPVATVDIGFTGYFKLYLFLDGMSHSNGASRAIGIAFGTGGTGGSFGTPIDLTSAIVAAATATVTVEFTVSATTAQPVTYATAGTTGFEAAVPAGANAIRIGPTTGGAFNGNLDAGTVTLIGVKLG